jgi:hypothetical protein
MTEDTQPDGTYAFANVDAADSSFEPIPVDSSLATPFTPLTFAPLENRVLNMVVPALSHEYDLTTTDQEVELGTGLFVTVNSDNIDPPLFTDPAESVAGVRVDAAHFPPMDWDAELLAVWYTAPFDHHSPNGLPYRITGDSDMGLVDGDVVEVWIGSYSSSSWNLVESMIFADGIATQATLPMFSTLALVRPGSP